MSSELNILLVDDSASDAFLTVKLLERDKPADCRLQVTRVPTLGAAKNTLLAAAFDCILLDWNLPDGRGNVAALHALAPQVVIVVLSGLEAADARAQALADGARAFVIKRNLHEAENLFALILDLIGAREAAGSLSPEQPA